MLPTAKLTSITLLVIVLFTPLCHHGVLGAVVPVSLRSCFGSSGGGSTNSGISASAVAGDDGSDLISLSADGVSEGDAGEDEVGDASEGASADGGGRRALAKGRVSRRTLRPEQPFRLPKLTLQWDSWTTSQMVTAAAAIILSEKLGFEIKLEAGRTTKEMFAAMSNGDVHMAFEAWTLSNKDMIQKYVSNDANSTIHLLPYTTLFGRSGIFETCSRLSSDTQLSQCSSGMQTEPLLRYEHQVLCVSFVRMKTMCGTD